MYSISIVAEDSRGPLDRILGECIRMSLEKWRTGEGWILCKINGLQCLINYPQLKYGRTLDRQCSSSRRTHCNVAFVRGGGSTLRYDRIVFWSVTQMTDNRARVLVECRPA
jgi:hypothetical protein